MALTLITGAPGWLASRLVRALLRGLPDVPSLAEPDPSRRIRCLALPGSVTPAFRAMAVGVDLREGDLRDPRAVREFCAGGAGGTMFHCAGVIHPRRTREFSATNVEGTRHLLAAAEAAGVRRVVVVSSSSPIGVSRDRRRVFDEASPYRPHMGYGRSKMLVEQRALAHGARGALEVVIVRSPWFYGPGPGEPARQARLFAMIRKGTMPIVGDGDNLRSMTYVDNLCQGLLLCERIPPGKGEIYWIADRRPYTMNEIVDTIERLMESELTLPVAHRRARLPDAAGELASLADWLLQRAGLYEQRLHVLSELNKTIVCSIARAEADLGYRPAVDLEEGVRRCLRWYLDQGVRL